MTRCSLWIFFPFLFFISNKIPKVWSPDLFEETWTYDGSQMVNSNLLHKMKLSLWRTVGISNSIESRMTYSCPYKLTNKKLLISKRQVNCPPFNSVFCWKTKFYYYSVAHYFLINYNQWKQVIKSSTKWHRRNTAIWQNSCFLTLMMCSLPTSHLNKLIQQICMKGNFSHLLL